MQPIQGLHHITAVASDPQANVDFYETVLGQRLVKTTVSRRSRPRARRRWWMSWACAGGLRCAIV